MATFDHTLCLRSQPEKFKRKYDVTGKIPETLEMLADHAQGRKPNIIFSLTWARIIGSAWPLAIKPAIVFIRPKFYFFHKL